MEKIKAGVIGATGYAGAELVRLLLSHPYVTLQAISSVSFEGNVISDIYPNLSSRSELLLEDSDTVIARSDVVFASLPHGLCEELAKKCMEKSALFIDLGADFRLEDENDYKQWYNLNYKEKSLHDQSVYSIPELHKRRLKNAKIIGNPGCYPTSAGLGLAPLLSEKLVDTNSIVIDSKSGVTGAGRGLTLNTHYPECNEAFGPYKIASHRHIPEIEQTLSQLAGKQVLVTFVPHLLPINRGIVSTMYASLSEDKPIKDIYELYKNYYIDAHFVRILGIGKTANLKYVKYSNYCDISLHLDERTNRIIVVSAIDNMMKGAASQAIQNMNIVCGLEENKGIEYIAPAF